MKQFKKLHKFPMKNIFSKMLQLHNKVTLKFKNLNRMSLHR